MDKDVKLSIDHFKDSGTTGTGQAKTTNARVTALQQAIVCRRGHSTETALLHVIVRHCIVVVPTQQFTLQVIPPIMTYGAEVEALDNFLYFGVLVSYLAVVLMRFFAALTSLGIV